MPDTPDLPLPEEFANWPEQTRPTRSAPNRLTFPSPFAEYPGTVTIVLHLSAPEYHDWWSVAGEDQPEEDKRHWALWTWETRRHLLKDVRLDNIESDVLHGDPLELPDMRLAVWLTAITQPIIKMATSLPNWPRPSSDI